MTACVLLAVMAAVSGAEGKTFVLHPKRFKIGPHVTSVIAADLDGDGIPEIVTSDRGRMFGPREERPAHDQLSYLVAEEPLKYAPLPQLRTGFAPYQIAVANIDALKAPDLIVVSFLATRDRDLSLLRNLGNHLFEPFHFSVPDEALRYTKMRDGDTVPIFTTPGLTSLVIEDFNNDGYRDAVATGWSSDVLVYFPGANDAYFEEPYFMEAHGGPRDIAAADLDGDGKLDLVVTLYSSNEVGFWKGDGKGRFTPQSPIASRGKLPHRIRIGDMNGDGALDLVVSHCHADDSILIFYGDGNGEFSVSQEILLGNDRGSLEAEIRDVVVADFDGNGRLDLAAACHTSGNVVVLMNRSKDATLPQRFEKEIYHFEAGKPWALCTEDFNRDGAPDLAVALWERNELALLIRR